MKQLRISLFGIQRLEWEEQPYKFSGLPKTNSLLAYLLLYRAHPLEREQVSFALWTDRPEANARANLRRHLHDLKRALPGDLPWILSDADTVRWNADAPYWLDVEEFERRSSGDDSAVALYQGDLCVNLYDDWIIPERERQREKYISVLERLIETKERAQNSRAALEYTQQLVRYDPLREETYRRWMRLLAQNGDRSGIVRAYNLCVTVLERDLGVEPDAETKQLYEQLVRREQVTLDTPTRVQDNLPNQLTPLIGRETEHSEIRAQLRAARLVTLTGTGGVGKTRLALQVAQSLLPEFADSVWFLDLGAIREPEQIVWSLAQTLEISETTNRPLRAVLLETLRTRRTLFVFDNCEHIVDTAAGLAHEILTHSAQVKILATSREPLRIPGERVIAIAPLPVPEETDDADPRTSLSSPGAQLLIARALAALPTFHVTAENAPALARICRAVQGIPLALELAAARLNVLSPQELAQRAETQIHFLEGGNRVAPLRHQTLQATFDWSFGALPMPQQILLTRLAVFHASFTLAAAERVCGFAPLENDMVLPLLSALIEKSLIVVEPANGTMRYAILNVTRQFALAQLGAGSARVRQQLLAYYVEQIEHHASYFYQAGQMEAYAWVDNEYKNVRTALETAWAMDLTALARLCGALWQYWWTRGYLTEGRVWLDRALAQSESLSGAQRAELLNGAGRLAVLQDDDVRARPLLEEHLALRRALRDPVGIGDALNSLGALQYHAGAMDDARASWQESLDLFRALEHVGFTARALNNLGDLAVTRGDTASGLVLLQESYALFQQLGASRGASIVLINLGTAALQANDVPRARAAFRDSLEIKRALQDQDGIAWTLEGLSIVAALENDFERALQLMGAAAKQRARLGTPTPAIFTPWLKQLEQDAARQLAPLQIDALLEQGGAFPLEQAIALALA